MHILSVIILGIVEGVTEFIPVSSTGHLILASALLGYDPERWKVFNVVIQLGAILAVLVLYWRTFWAVAVGLLAIVGGGFAWWEDRRATQAEGDERTRHAVAEAERRQAAELALGQAEDHLRADRPDAAEAGLTQAGLRLGSDGPADLRGRLAERQKDLATAHRLARVRDLVRGDDA